LIAILLCATCRYDPAPIKQHLRGTWKLQIVDYFINDTLPENVADEYITLTFTAEDRYIETHAVGPVTYSGDYRIPDANHLTFINRESPNNKSKPPYTVTFQLNDDTLILTGNSRETYRRIE
jgi:hypothetical protein